MSQKGGTLIYSICRIKYTFYAEDGSNVSAVVIGEGMDSGDKATNKAMSIAFKYACFQVFCIPTEEMKDKNKVQVLYQINTGSENVKSVIYERKNKIQDKGDNSFHKENTKKADTSIKLKYKIIGNQKELKLFSKHFVKKNKKRKLIIIY